MTYSDYLYNPSLLDSYKFSDKINLKCPVCLHDFLSDKRAIYTCIKKLSKNGPCCSRKCASSSRTEVSYHECLHCSKTVRRTSSNSTGNIFCSSSCSATHGNLSRKHSMATKEKIANSLKERAKKIPPKQREKIFKTVVKKEKECPTCSRLFYSRNKYCSKPCYLSSEERKIQCMKAGQNSSKKRALRSKDEIALFNMVSAQFSNCLSNHVIDSGWDADIVLPDHKIAILWNGPWHYKQLNISNHSLSQVQNRDRIKKKLFEKLGWTVLVYEDRYYTPETAYNDIISKLA